MKSTTTNPMTTTTNLDITPDSTVNDVLARHPDAQPVFHRHGIDSCCGGALPLATVAQKHDLDLDGLIAELRQAASA